MLSIPVSILSTFGFMKFAEVSLNFMSIGGLALGVGMLVDSSIVVLEAANRKTQTVPDYIKAVDNGLREVRSSVIAGTLTTVAILVPIMFMTGLGQRLFRDFAFTLSGALIMSLLTSLALLPALLVYLRSNRSRMVAGAHSEPRMEKAYEVIVTRSLRFRGPILGLFVVLLFACVWIVATLGCELLPKVDQGKFEVRLVLSPNSSLDRMEWAIERAEAALNKSSYVHSYISRAGVEPKKDIGKAIDIRKSNEASISVDLKPDAPDRSRIQRQLERGLKEEFSHESDIEVKVSPSMGFIQEQLGERGAPEIIRLLGDDLSTLGGLADRAAKKLSNVRSLEGLHREGDVWVKQEKVIVDRYQAAKRGLLVSDIAEEIQTAVEGRVTGQFIRNDEEIDIRVRLRPADVRNDRDLKLLPLVHYTGDSNEAVSKSARDKRTVPLGRIADIQSGLGPREILRFDNRQGVVFRADVVGAFSRGQKEALDAVKSFQMPNGYRITGGSESLEIVSSLGRLASGLGLVIMLIYVILVIQFESLVLPLVVMAIIPMTLIGPAPALAGTGIPVSVLVLFGALALMGIVVNNAILMVSSIIKLKEQGIAGEQAIVQGCKARLQPILISTLTTVVGALPVCLGWGSAAALRQPLAITVVTGLSASLFVTLLMVPLLYGLISRKEAGQIGGETLEAD
jgi:HAE1 family hydrophobic/amphiphilic exporter-1